MENIIDSQSVILWKMLHAMSHCRHIPPDVKCDVVGWFGIFGYGFISVAVHSLLMDFRRWQRMYGLGGLKIIFQFHVS